MRLWDLTGSSRFGCSGDGRRRADLFPARNLPSYYGAYAEIQQGKGLSTHNLACNACPAADDFFIIYRPSSSTLTSATLKKLTTMWCWTWSRPTGKTFISEPNLCEELTWNKYKQVNYIFGSPQFNSANHYPCARKELEQWL